jgi:hypothetical protein
MQERLLVLYTGYLLESWPDPWCLYSSNLRVPIGFFFFYGWYASISDFSEKSETYFSTLLSRLERRGRRSSLEGWKRDWECWGGGDSAILL